MLCYHKNTKLPITVHVETKLGSGGEGTVYAIADTPDLCVKIFHEKKRTPELEKKIDAMIAAPPKDPTLASGHYSISWPIATVYADEACTEFLGFTMPLIDTNIFKAYHLLCDKPGASSSACYRLEHFGTGFTYLHMYVVALNLASCVSSIHEAGHAIGDLNDKNILVSTKDCKLTVIDCDSFEIHGKDGVVYPCTVCMPEYSAPEVIKHEPIADRQQSDRFALAVLLFKLFMFNTHPFSARGTSVEHLNTPEEKIADGYYPYENHPDIDVSPPVYAMPYGINPLSIKELFRRCFVDGHYAPEKRPTSREWLTAIREQYLQMTEFVKLNKTMCSFNSMHMYPLHLSDCPWCNMKDEYFPKKYDMKKKHVSGKYNYIKDLLYVLLDNQILTNEEFHKLENAAIDSGVSKHELHEIIQEAKRQNSTIVLGSHMSVTPKSLWFETNLKNSQVLSKEVYLTNNYIYDSVKVNISDKFEFLQISETSFLLLPGESKQLFIDLIQELMPEKLIKEFKIEVTISISARTISDEKILMVYGATNK